MDQMIKTTSEILGGRSPRSEASRILKRMIENGTWSFGERIPSEQQLCTHIGVSRRTVRVALQELEDKGMLDSQGRKGRFVSWKGRPQMTMLTQTIVVITNTQGNVDPMEVGGNLLSVDAGVLFELGETGRPSLVIPGHNLNEFPVEELITNRPAGVIVVEPRLRDTGIKHLLAECVAEEIPVAVNGYSQGMHSYPRVISDHQEGCRILTDRLVVEGARRILLMQNDIEGIEWPADKIAGYHQAMTSTGLAPLPVLHTPGLTMREDRDEVFATRIRQLAGFLVEYLHGPERVDAILVMSDSDLFPVAEACKLFGLDPQRDIMLAGYDNYWQSCYERKYCDFIPRFTVDKQNHLTGRILVRTLMEQADDHSGVPVCKRVPPQLIEVPVVGSDPDFPT